MLFSVCNISIASKDNSTLMIFIERGRVSNLINKCNLLCLSHLEVNFRTFLGVIRTGNLRDNYVKLTLRDDT